MSFDSNSIQTKSSDMISVNEKINIINNFPIYHENWETFEKALQKYCDLTYQPFRKRSSDTIKANNKRKAASTNYINKTELNINESYGFLRKVYKCTHGFQIRSRGNGKRPRQNYRYLGCEATIHAKLVKHDTSMIPNLNNPLTDLPSLTVNIPEYVVKVTLLNTQHNHQINEQLYKAYEESRVIHDVLLLNENSKLNEYDDTNINQVNNTKDIILINKSKNKNNIIKDQNNINNNIKTEINNNDHSINLNSIKYNNNHHDSLSLSMINDDSIVNVSENQNQIEKERKNQNQNQSQDQNQDQNQVSNESNSNNTYFLNDKNFLARVNDPLLINTQSYINGEWITSNNKSTWPVIDPATCNTLAQVSNIGKNETEKALQYASASFKIWEGRPAMERSMILKKWSKLIRTNIENLSNILTGETGKPIFESREEITLAAHIFEYYAHECARHDGFMIPASLRSQKIISTKQAIGVIAIFPSYKFPISMMVSKIAPALAIGCTVIVKLHKETPLASLSVAYLGQQSGIPAGVINFLTGIDFEDVDKIILTSPYVNKICYLFDTIQDDDNNSSNKINQIVIENNQLDYYNKLSIEMGGNIPFIVFEDANIEAAISGALISCFRHTGQNKASCSQIFVHENIHDRFTTRFALEVSKLKVGNGFCNETDIGPLINSNKLKETQKIILDAIEKGAEILTGGKQHPYLNGNFFEPTVIININKNMDLYRKSKIAPIAPIIKYNNEETLLDILGNEKYSIAGYFYSQDINKIWRTAQKLKCNMIGVNTGILSVAHAPFGTINEISIRSNGPIKGMDEFSQTKYICIGGIEEV